VNRAGGWRKLGRAEILWLVVFLFGALLTCLSGCNVDDGGTGSTLVVPDPATGRPPAADAGAEVAAVQLDAGGMSETAPAAADAGAEAAAVQLDAGGMSETAPAAADVGPAILPQCPGSAARVIVCAIGEPRGTCSAYNAGEKVAPVWGCFIRDDNDWHFVCVEACH
jgi:hypothetical protein